MRTSFLGWCLEFVRSPYTISGILPGTVGVFKILYESMVNMFRNRECSAFPYILVTRSNKSDIEGVIRLGKVKFDFQLSWYHVKLNNCYKS